MKSFLLLNRSLLRRTLGIFQNGYFFPFPCQKHKCFFLALHNENLWVSEETHWSMEAFSEKTALRVSHSNVTIHTQPQQSVSVAVPTVMAPAASFSDKLIFACDSLCSPLSRCWGGQFVLLSQFSGWPGRSHSSDRFFSLLILSLMMWETASNSVYQSWLYKPLHVCFF